MSLPVRTSDKGRLEVRMGSRWKAAKMVDCIQCGKKFAASVYHYDVRGEGRFCSQSCRLERLHIRRRGVVVTCVICKRIRLVQKAKRDRIKTCGRPACQYKLRRRIALRRHAVGGFGVGNRKNDGKYATIKSQVA